MLTKEIRNIIAILFLLSIAECYRIRSTDMKSNENPLDKTHSKSLPEITNLLQNSIAMNTTKSELTSSNCVLIYSGKCHTGKERKICGKPNVWTKTPYSNSIKIGGYAKIEIWSQSKKKEGTYWKGNHCLHGTDFENFRWIKIIPRDLAKERRERRRKHKERRAQRKKRNARRAIRNRGRKPRKYKNPPKGCAYLYKRSGYRSGELYCANAKVTKTSGFRQMSMAPNVSLEFFTEKNFGGSAEYTNVQNKIIWVRNPHFWKYYIRSVKVHYILRPSDGCVTIFTENNYKGTSFYSCDEQINNDLSLSTSGSVLMGKGAILTVFTGKNLTGKQQTFTGDYASLQNKIPKVGSFVLNQSTNVLKKPVVHLIKKMQVEDGCAFLFTGCNFEGIPLKLCGNDKRNFDVTYCSFIPGKHTTIELFSKENLKGSNFMFSTILKEKPWWKDNTRSVRVHDDRNPSDGCVIFYKDCNFGGDSKIECGLNKPDMEKWRNSVASIKVGKGAILTLWKGTWYRSSKKTFQTNDKCLSDCGFKNRSQSFQIRLHLSIATELHLP